MQRIKTYMGITTMQSTRLSNFALLSIDKENSEKLIKDPVPVLELFGKMKNRRLQIQI